MFTLMGKYKALYFGSATAIIAVIAVTAVLSDRIANGFGVALFAMGALFIVLLARFCTRRADSEYRSMLRILDEECDPEAFMEAHIRIYSNACKRRRIAAARDVYAAVARVDQAVALSCAGQHSNAISEICSLLDLPITVREESLRSMLHSYLAAFYLSRGEESDTSLAREHIEKARRYMSTDTSGGSRAGELTRIEYRLNLAEGENLQSVLDYFSKSADNSRSLRESTANRWLLGLTHEKLGDVQSARTEYAYVAQNSPKTNIGKLAAQRLTELTA